MTPYEKKLNELTDECIKDFNDICPLFTNFGDKWGDFLKCIDKYPINIQDRLEIEFEKLNEAIKKYE